MNKRTETELFTILGKIYERIEHLEKRTSTIASQLRDLPDYLDDRFEMLARQQQRDARQLAQVDADADDRVIFSTHNLSEIARTALERARAHALEITKTNDSITETMKNLMDEIRHVEGPGKQFIQAPGVIMVSDSERLSRKIDELVAAGKL